MNRLQENLDAARFELLLAQRAIRMRRLARFDGHADQAIGPDWARAVSHFYHCLDRAWEAQCMVGGSY